MNYNVSKVHFPMHICNCELVVGNNTVIDKLSLLFLIFYNYHYCQYQYEYKLTTQLAAVNSRIF